MSGIQDLVHGTHGLREKTGSLRLQCIQASPKTDSTLRSCQAVPHPSSDRALRRLNAVVERDLAHSTWYGRQRRNLHEKITSFVRGWLSWGWGLAFVRVFRWNACRHIFYSYIEGFFISERADLWDWFKLTWLVFGGDPAARSHRVEQFTAL